MGPHRDKPNSGPTSFSDDDDPQYVMEMMLLKMLLMIMTA